MSRYDEVGKSRDFLNKAERNCWECKRCMHKWTAKKAYHRKGEKPKVCPRCKSPYWSTERKMKMVKI